MRQEFLVLGDVRVAVDGRVIDVGHARQWCVLAALLVDANRPVPLELVIDRVWGERTPQRARSATYTYLSRLRHSLAAADVAISRRLAGYVLTVDPDAVDLHRFSRLTARTRVADSDTAALDLWERALALWRGDAFANLDTVWLAAIRADLDRQRWTAYLDRNDLALRLGHHTRLLAGLSAAVDSHPLDERVAGQLMLALYRCGRQGDALIHFDRTRRLLADEIGADPSPPLCELHHQILTNDAALRPAALEPVVLSAPDRGSRRTREPTSGADAGRWPTHPPTQLPADAWAFTGRAEELSRLDALLDAGQGRDGARSDEPTAVVISAVSGTAGVGKTSLAVRWAHRVRERFPDGQLYVNLRGYDPEQPMPPADALAGLLSALGVRGQDIPLDVDGRAAVYRNELSGRRMLLLLDNAGSVEQVRPLLPGTPTCLVVVTSRDSLAGLVAVHGARRLDLDMLSAGDAVTLLRRLVGDRVDADPAAAMALADLCVRLPLALRIAAEHASSRPALGLADLVTELTDLHHRLDLLDAGDPHASVRAVFSWSYRQLPADAARMFRLLGLHPGADIDDRGAAALTGGDLPSTGRLLVALTRAHLIQPTGARRYGMHDLLRAYAVERVTEDDEADRRTALTRLLDHYLAAAVAAMDVLFPDREVLLPDYTPALCATRPADTDAALAWLDAERANLAAACAHAARHGWDRHAVGLAGTLGDYLDTGGHLVDALSIYTHARDAARRLRDRTAESIILWGLGSIHWSRAAAAQSLDYFRQSLALCRELGDRAGEAHALHGLGNAHLWQGQLAAAGRALRRAHSILKELDDPADVFVLTTLGNLYGRQGRFTLARDHFHEALAACRRRENRAAEMIVLRGLSMLIAWHGPFDEAAEHAEQALVLARQLNHASGETAALTGLGIVCARRGQLDQAADHLRQALTRCRHMGFRSEETRALYNLGIVHERQGHLELAADQLQQAVDRYRQTGEEPGVADALHALGVVHTRDGRPELAADKHREALAIFRRLNHPDGEALARNGLGEALYVAGHLRRARDQHTAALTVATTIDDRHEQARAHSGIARICLTDGDPVQARHHWEIALSLNSALHSPEVGTVLAHLTALRATRQTWSNRCAVGE